MGLPGGIDDGCALRTLPCRTFAAMLQNDLLLRAARGETVGRVPVRMMRQAGRILAEYRAVRERTRDFITLAKTKGHPHQYTGKVDLAIPDLTYFTLSHHQDSIRIYSEVSIACS